jgi:peptidoglycan hydrolase CwlO-like protein
MIVINQPVKITTEALQQKLQRAGLDERIKRGAASYKGVTLSEISKDKIDVYTKVETAPNNTSMVYMAVSKGYNNFTNSEADSLITQNTIAFLNSFVKDADNHFADLDISNQMTDVNKSEKQYQHLLDEQRDLEKKKSAIDTRLTEIQNELATRKTDMDKKKSAVEESKIKRSSDNK